MKSQSGFTLIEIMLVVIIIGILASMVVPSFRGRAREARVNAAKGDLASLGVALDLFELDKGRYPSSINELLTSDRKYLKEAGIPLDPWRNQYVYRCPGQHDKDGYDLISYGPDGVEGGADDIASWNL
jgi:general secretion pathway protein G